MGGDRTHPWKQRREGRGFTKLPSGLGLQGRKIMGLASTTTRNDARGDLGYTSRNAIKNIVRPNPK